jgi:hypothetical protein
MEKLSSDVKVIVRIFLIKIIICIGRIINKALIVCLCVLIFSTNTFLSFQVGQYYLIACRSLLFSELEIKWKICRGIRLGIGWDQFWLNVGLTSFIIDDRDEMTLLVKCQVDRLMVQCISIICQQVVYYIACLLSYLSSFTTMLNST